MSITWEQKVNVLAEQAARHDERLDVVERSIEKQNGTLKDIRDELQKLRIDYANRPSWPVTVIVTVLSTLAGSLAVYVITLAR